MRILLKKLLFAAKRRPLLTAALVVLILVRAALPLVVENVVETSVAETLRLSLDVGDVDFGLLRGTLTAEDVRIAGPDAARDEDGRLCEADAVIGWNGVTANLRWLALLRGRIELSSLTLERPVVRTRREESGSFNLVELFNPGQAVGAAAEEPEGEATAVPPVAVNVLELRRGRLAFEDQSTEKGAAFVLEIDALDVEGFTWPLPPQGQEARLMLRSVLDGGMLQVRATASEHDDGAVAVRAEVDAENLRMVGVRAYTSTLGWADLRGLLDVDLELDVLGGQRQRVTGNVSLRQAAVGLPERENVPLWIERLTLQDADVDLTARALRLGELRLSGASVLADPWYGPILPILVAGTDGSSAAAPVEAAPLSDVAWSWSIDSVVIDETQVHVVTKTDPLAVGVTANLEGLSSDDGKIAAVTLSIKEGEGSLDLEGRLCLAPIGAGAALRWSSLDLGRLASAVPFDDARALRGGVSDGELTIRAGLAASNDGDDGSMSADDLVVNGKLSVRELAVELRDGFESDVAWQSLDVGLDEVIVPSLLAEGVPERNDAPISIRIGDLSLKAPNLRLVLDSAQAQSDSAGAERGGNREMAATAGEEMAMPDGGAASEAGESDRLRLTIGRLDVRDARVAIAERGGNTPFTGTLTASEIRSSSVAWPQRSARELLGIGSVFKRGSWSIRGDVVERAGKVEIRLDQVPLVPLSALTDDLFGLSIRRGSLTDATSLTVTPEAFESRNAVTLRDLQVGGQSAEDSFAQTFGMPLSLTLALLKDTSGDISLSLPFASERGRGRAGLTTAFVGVVREAIVGAAMSPLKIVGSVVYGEDKVEGFSLEPIDFAPGGVALPPDADAQLEALAELVGGRPGLALRLRPVIARADARALRERALLDLMERGAPQGEGAEDLSWLVRRRLRSYLESRRDGDSAELDSEDAAVLDRALAALPEPRDALARLVSARILAIEEALSRRYAVNAEQLVTASMPDLARRKEGLPRVEFELVAAGE